MKLNELIKKVEFDEVWMEIKNAYDFPNKVKSVYEGVYDELKEISINAQKSSDEAFTIGVCELEDVLEPGVFVFDVFGISHDDSNRYSLIMETWNNWISYDVLDKSVELYGTTIVLAHILYEITFYGYSSHDSKKKQEEITEELKGVQESIDNGFATFISSEEVYAALGLEKVKEVDSELEKRKNETIKATMDRNDLRLKDLMSDWRCCH
ncbi:MAG: hypothetical protein JW702_01755 [Clostridiales bacterium]|nr:hypothetical protein [Clostridiales bacterium]